MKGNEDVIFCMFRKICVMRNMRLKGKTLISLCVAIGAMALSFNELYAAKKVQPNRQVLWYTREGGAANR